MEAQEICGFLDSQGRFHKTKQECERAEARYKLVVLENRLDYFENEVSEYLFEEYNYDPYGNRKAIQSYILERIVKMVLQNSSMFIDIINSKEQLKKELDIRKKELNKDKIFYEKWWLKIKWW